MQRIILRKFLEDIYKLIVLNKMSIKECVQIILILLTQNGVGQNEYTVKKIDCLSKVSSVQLHTNPEKAFKLSVELCKASKKKNYGFDEAVNLYYQSIYFLEAQGDFKKALLFNNRAYQGARNINNDSLALYNNFRKSTLLGSLGMYEKAVSITDACLKQTDMIESSKKRSLLRGPLLNYKAKFLAEGNFKTSKQVILAYFIKLMNEFDKVLIDCHNTGYSSFGLYYYKLNKLDEAAKYCKKAIPFFKSKKVISCEHKYTSLAKPYTKTKNFPLALQYLDNSGTICQKVALKDHALLASNSEIKSKTPLNLNEKDSVIIYKNSDPVYTDSLNKEKAKQTEKSFAYLTTESEKEKEKRDELNRKLYPFIILMVVAIGITLIILYKKNNKLKVETLTKAVDLQQKTTEITELKQKVITSYSELIEIAKNNDPLFSSLFKELYPDFYENLMAIQPNLTLSEQRVCFYIKLKFLTKEIADYTFVSVKAIQNRKNRLRKRLNIKEGVDIYQWIDAL